MKLSDLGLPIDRQQHVKDVCECFEAQSLSQVEFTFEQIGRRRKVWTTGNQEIVHS